MSYNIDNIEVIYKLGFSITTKKFSSLQKKYENDAPADSIFDQHIKEIDDRLFPDRFTWRSEGSGHSHEILKKILSEFDGEADLILTWEGGDSVSGLRLRNHKVTEHEVIMQLGTEVK